MSVRLKKERLFTSISEKKNRFLLFMYKRFFLLFILFCFAFLDKLSAQIKVSGTVLSEIDKKPIEFGTIVVLEAKLKIRFKNGIFTLDLKEPGVFTFKTSAPGFAIKSQKVDVQDDQTLVIYLSPTTIRTRGLRVRDQREVQKLSRNTLSQRELKDVPATFGDSLNALTVLPGVIRPLDLLGVLIIRGSREDSNRYYIDSIPVLYPQHFGGLQSVISNELIDKIDLYSSSFPVQFSEALGAVIDISTKDTVKDFNGKVIISFLSSDVYFEDVFTSMEEEPLTSFPLKLDTIDPECNDPKKKKLNPQCKKNQSNKENQPNKENKNKEKKRGYWIVSGRVSYLTLTIGPILRAIMGDDNDDIQLPQYYDYQLKGKYFLDEKAKHSISLLFFGFYDTTKFITGEPTKEEIQEAIDDGQDPLTASSSSQIRNSILSNNLGLYYKYEPSQKINNQLILFAGFNRSTFFVDIPGLSREGLELRTIDVNISPNIFGIKDISEWNWLDNIALFRLGLEINFYYFTSNGITQAITDPSAVFSGMPDLGDQDLFRSINIDFSEVNTFYSAFLENSFEFYNFKIVPGIRLSLLQLTQQFTYDPRLLLSYEFDWEMIISGSYGLYSSFPQINYFLFNQVFNQQPDVARSVDLKPEKARHASIGLEQKIFLFTVKTEWFYNMFLDQLIPTPRGLGEEAFINSADVRATGFELLFRLNRYEKNNSFYGWASYTFTDSQRILNVDTNIDIYGDTYLPFEFEQPHSLKLALGYILGKNNFGIRFELSSGFPYTPIVDNEPPLSLSNGVDRYSPIFGDPLSSRFPLRHRLDIRYTRTSVFSWGSIDWYLEVINLYYYRPDSTENWNYNEPYQSGVNPELSPSPLSVILLNFGVEIKF